MPSAKVTTKGQITIPAAVREALGLKPGMKIDFYQIGEGEFAFTARNRSVKDLAGILPKLGYVPTIEEMDQAVLDAVAEDYQRAMSRSDGGEATSDEAA